MGEKEDSSKPAAGGALGRPTITLPARPYGESFFNGGGFGFSPGPMTLVSSFFSDSDDCKSFSQLLAGAMVPPSDTATAAVSAAQQRPEGSGGVNSVAEVDTRFKQNRPAGLVVTPPPPAAAFTVPPGLSPAMLLESPSFLGLFSPAQGNFLMSHQQALAQVTAHAVQANNSQIQIHPQYSSSDQNEQSRIPETLTRESSEFYPAEQHRTQQPQTVDKPADDGYNWRKYGQKHVKGSEYPRSYYKCTNAGCTVKKKVERSLDGQVTEIIYKGQHNHQPPQNNKRGKDGRNLNSDSGFQFQGGGGIRVKNDNETSQATTEQMSEASDSEEVGDAGTGTRGKDEDEPDAKRRSTEARVSEAASSSSSHRTVSEPRIIVQTTSEVDLLDDGYRWRKYGQKVVKGNPYPRSYYKCTTQGCNVRKHVERAPTDPKAVITTYEGKHNHDLPAARTGSHAAAAAAANSQLRHDGLNSSNIPQQPIARLRLKEEQTT